MSCTEHEGIPGTTVRRALEDMQDRMPPDRWTALVAEAHRRTLIRPQTTLCRRDRCDRPHPMR
ncbi:hypothetical protein GCM10023167_23680 [Brevibacterium pityocampae]|uniref:Uncharacterized protein n=1 Tax=Brevibacterium pityocampae TaxID=506594 RepID=A0ABP8JPG4_9MICO